LSWFFSGFHFGMDGWEERELSQLAADGGRLTWRIAGRRAMLGDDGNQMKMDGSFIRRFRR
jgi:hypothetical protein